MQVQLFRSEVKSGAQIAVSGSKSETNRLLLLQALYPEISLKNGSGSDDTAAVRQALSHGCNKVDVHHAGTAMRFLTAYFATQPGAEVEITGSERMQQRPIGILVAALQALGADIEYLKTPGFPPLRIKGKAIEKNQVSMNANVSSQFLSALLLVAPKLKNGLELTLEGTLTSRPYLEMTLALLQSLGVETQFSGNRIVVKPQPKIAPVTHAIESDWSSASYWYSVVALSDIGTKISLQTYRANSLQGDSALTGLYDKLGVQSSFLEQDTLVLTKISEPEKRHFQANLNDCPDIAQTIAVTCMALGISCELTGLHTLRIKETDRLFALQQEMGKFGGVVSVTDDSLTLQPAPTLHANVSVATYQDHRMAMAFAPLALRVPLTIENAEVVSKSYPDFWKDLKMVGFTLEESVQP